MFNYKCVYQVIFEEDMNNWIVFINNVLQSVMEGRVFQEKVIFMGVVDGFFKWDIGFIFIGKFYFFGYGMYYYLSSSSGMFV